ncbi:hypothetical protein Tco_1386256 [Tanacetum coccineum]
MMSKPRSLEKEQIDASERIAYNCLDKRNPEDSDEVDEQEESVTVCYMMDNPNITMEEYIRLEEEKARGRGEVFNWETAKYGKIQIDEDVHNLKSVETKFLAITLINEISSEKKLSYEPTISSLNNEVDFRISFDDFDNEDHTDSLKEISMEYWWKFTIWNLERCWSVVENFKGGCSTRILTQ